MVDIHIESHASLANSEHEGANVSDDRYIEFIQGFNSALPLSNIIVVGYDSKERIRKVEGLLYFIRSTPSRALTGMA